MNPSPGFRCLSAPGAAALSIWALDCTVGELTALLAGQTVPPPGPARLRRLVDAEGVTLDEGLMHMDSSGDRMRAEWHLHGGFGVAAAMRGRLGELDWAEVCDERSRDERRYFEALAPLNARVAEAALDGRLDRELNTAASRDIQRWAEWGRWLDAPPRCVIAGPANSGKSTLFNAWLQQERVTVSPHPGTTRDSVSAGICLGAGEAAWEARLIDTAGWWGGATGADAAALAATEAALAAADRVLWVLDAATAPDSEWIERVRQHAAPSVRLLHRADLEAVWNPEAELEGPWLRGSTLQEGLSFLERVEAALAATFGPPPGHADPVPLGPERLEHWRSAAAG